MKDVKGKICGHMVAGKNATNLKAHMEVHHPALKRFKHLVAKMEAQATTAATAQAGCETPQVQLQKYIVEMQENVQHPNALNYWTGHYSTYNRLADTALDLLAAPASQAYVERVFSVCGMLTQGRRNRMTQSLEMRE